MKTFILLLIALMTGCKADDNFEVTGCIDGWVDFTCRYPSGEQYQDVSLETREQTLESKHMDRWDDHDNFSLFHDTTNKHLRVIIRKLQQKDLGKYKCKFSASKKLDEEHETEVDLQKDDKKLCQKLFVQTAYRTAKTTISCDHPARKHMSEVGFFCKLNGSICETILTEESSTPSNGTFTFIKTSSGFNVSISKVSSHHHGKYWCGLKLAQKNGKERGSYRTGFREIQLTVEMSQTTTTHSATKTTTTSAPTVSSTTHSTSASDPPFTTIIPIICVALLLLVVILVLVYKRHSLFKARTNQEAQMYREERAYEEIQECPKKPDSETPLRTIYVTANHPTDAHAYSSISFTNNDEINDATYCTVKDNSSPAYSTVNHPSRSPEDPFYSTLSNPQQQ